MAAAKYIGLLGAALLALVACSSNATPEGDARLPLAEDKPTFIYFYTDN